jgi:hypothetical protein
MRRILRLSLVLSILAAPIMASSAQAAVTPGASCSPVGMTIPYAGKKFTCIKSGKKGVWNKGSVITKITSPNAGTSKTSTESPSPSTPATPKFGSFALPVPTGGSLQVGKVAYQIAKVDFNVNSAVCAGNGFNDGCTYDDNFQSIPDPKSTFTWTAVSVTAVNKSGEIVSPQTYGINFYLVLPNGQLLQNNIFTSGFPNQLSDINIIPGGTGTGTVLFEVPKNVNSLKTVIVLRDSTGFISSSDYYFEISW